MILAPWSMAQLGISIGINDGLLWKKYHNENNGIMAVISWSIKNEIKWENGALMNCLA